LINVLRSNGVGVDDLFMTNLVRILEVVKIVVVHVWRCVVNAANLAFLTNLNLGSDWVNRGSGVVDVGTRACRRNCLQVAVVEAVLHNLCLQVRPVFRTWGVDGGVSKECLDLIGLRRELSWIVAVEECTRGVLGVLELAEGLATLLRNLVRCTKSC